MKEPIAGVCPKAVAAGLPKVEAKPVFVDPNVFVAPKAIRKQRSDYQQLFQLSRINSDTFNIALQG